MDSNGLNADGPSSANKSGASSAHKKPCCEGKQNDRRPANDVGIPAAPKLRLRSERRAGASESLPEPVRGMLSASFETEEPPDELGFTPDQLRKESREPCGNWD